MTKAEFITEMEALLNKYCKDNPDYENVNVRNSIKRDVKQKHDFDIIVTTESYVNTLFSTYLIACKK